MMDRLNNLSRREAQRAQAQIALPKVGIVTSYDPANYSAKVRIMPEDVESGWLPIRSPWSGNGWGMFCPPSPGDEVEVQHQEGGRDAAYVALRSFGDRSRPLPTPAGEFRVVHRSGARFVLRNDGTAGMTDGHGATITLNGDGTANITASLITSNATRWDHVGEFNASKFFAENVSTIPDGTYCTGFGLATNGYITVRGGMITAIQEAS